MIIEGNQQQETSVQDAPSENFVDETIQERQSLGEFRPKEFSKSGILNIRVSQVKENGQIINQL